MCKIIAIANQKGGVAKTTTTINLGVGLSKVGKRVMLIDADPQGHLTMGLGFPKNLRVTLKTMMENIIMGLEFDPREAILHHEEGIDVISSNKLLSGMDMSLFTVEDREKVLKEYLELLENDYDYILIDCMPSLGMMTINALSAADSVLIPVQPQYYAADGLMELLKVVKGMHYNPFVYIRSEKDILKLVTTIIANTKGEGQQSGEDFWVKAEKLYYCALIGYIWYEGREEEKNFNTLLEMINASEAREDDENFKNPVDLMFDELEQKDPNHFAVRQYKKYKLAAGDICSK